MNNLQAPEKIIPFRNPTQDEVGFLSDREEFVDFIDCWKTIQGEGPFVGMPAAFIRLAGCNLQCPMCDTDYTKNRMLVSVGTIVNTVCQIQWQGRLVVITGGEPFRQSIAPLVRELLLKHYTVQIETNGTLYRDDLPYDKIHIVCSPKSPVINGQLRPHIKALKYVVQAGHIDAGDGLPTSVLGMKCRAARPLGFNLSDIYVQPADEDDPIKNKANLDAALASCMKFGYRMCLQTHKLLGLP